MKLKFKRYGFMMAMMLGMASGYEMALDEFYKRIEQNSIPLIQNKANFDSTLQDYKASMSWGTSYVESEISMGKVGNNQAFNIESTTLLMLTPRLPWVSAMMRSSFKTKSLQYQKQYDLLKTLALIGAKRLYFGYEIMEEKYNIYKQREQIFLSQLKIAEAKLKAGSVAKKDYTNFKNSYYEAKLARMETQKQIVNLRASLLKALGLSEYDGVIRVRDLGFEIGYRKEDLESFVQNSPYLEILALSAKDNAINAKASSAMRFDSFEIGAGLQNTTQGNLQENLATLRVQIPIPLTTKYGHLKKKYLILQSAALRELEVKKNNLKLEAQSYVGQLEIKREYMELQNDSVANKKALMDMGKTAYESQKISLFEYLSYQNSYMESLIKRLDAKMDYIDVETLLEEALGVILTQGKDDE